MIGFPSISVSNNQVSDNLFYATVVSLVCFVVVAGHYYYKNKFSYWKNKGIKGPEPWPIVGNAITIGRVDRMKQGREWPVKYGKLYGIYFATQPHLYICDPEIVLQIGVRDFDSWPNHEVFEFFNKYQKSFLFFTQDATWKRVRAFMTPTFTSAKVRRMFKLLNSCADDLVECFRECLGTGKSTIVNLRDVYFLYAVDSIATCCYGTKLDRTGASSLEGAAARNEFVKVSIKIFDLKPFRFLLSILLPKFLLKMIEFEVVPRSSYDPLVAITTKLMETRKNQRGKRFDDYLQMLIDAKLEDKLNLNDMDSRENHHAGLTPESLSEDQVNLVKDVNNSTTPALRGKIELSDLEILSNAMLLQVVGVETTGTLMISASYILAHNQEIQKRLRKEIALIAEFSGDKKSYSFSYEAITSCQYLDAFVSEVLRFFPSLIMTERVSIRDYHIEKYNLDLPKGSKVIFSLCALFSSPDYWDKPEEFNPDRFMPGNQEKIVPGAYCPFGLGRRHCLGMRFALTEAKLALAKTLMNFKFEPAPGTKFPPKFKCKIAFNSIVNPIVKLVPR